MFRVVNETRGTVEAERVQHARSFWSRFKGLMLRKGLAEGEGLFIEPSSSIHTAFMRFAIDAVFVDRENRVVKIVDAIKPYRLAFSKGHSVLELKAGAAVQSGMQPGDTLRLQAA